MAFARYDRSIPEIIGDLIGQAGALIRKEGQLARAEISEKVGEAGLGVGLIAAGAVFAIPALVILLQAAVEALATTGLSPAMSALIIGGVALLIAIVLAAVGIARLKSEKLAPRRTIRQLQKDADLAAHPMRDDRGTQRAV